MRVHPLRHPTFGFNVFLRVQSIVLDPLLECSPQAVGVGVSEGPVVLKIELFQENFHDAMALDEAHLVSEIF